MNGTVLVAYGTRHGSTREVAEAIGETLRSCGLEVDTIEADRVPELRPYTAVVIGGAIYMGHWHPSALAFLQYHRHTLAAIPVAAFGMGPRTLDESDVAASRSQLEKALARVPEVEPFAVEVFGGVIDPKTLRFPFNRMTASDARDWGAIRRWATEIAPSLDFGKAAAESRDRRSELQQTHR